MHPIACRDAAACFRDELKMVARLGYPIVEGFLQAFAVQDEVYDLAFVPAPPVTMFMCKATRKWHASF